MFVSGENKGVLDMVNPIAYNAVIAVVIAPPTHNTHTHTCTRTQRRSFAPSQLLKRSSDLAENVDTPPKVQYIHVCSLLNIAIYIYIYIYIQKKRGSVTSRLPLSPLPRPPPASDDTCDHSSSHVSI